MLSNCFHCNKIASSDTITCTFCNNIIHILCLYDAKIIDVQVAHNNKPKYLRIMLNLYLIVLIFYLNALVAYQRYLSIKMHQMIH